MQFPNQLQAALLFPATGIDLEAIVSSVLRLLEWREKRALAEGIGGRFEVRSRDWRSPDSTPPPTPLSPLPGPPRFGLRPVFGRKIVGD